MRLRLHSVQSPYLLRSSTDRAHAVHDAAAGEAAHHGLEVKCVAEDGREHARYIPDVQEDDEQRNQYIQDTHERNKDFGDACQTLCAAEYHYAEQERQNDADERRRDNRMVELEHRECGLRLYAASML